MEPLSLVRFSTEWKNVRAHCHSRFQKEFVPLLVSTILTKAPMLAFLKSKQFDEVHGILWWYKTTNEGGTLMIHKVEFEQIDETGAYLGQVRYTITVCVHLKQSVIFSFTINGGQFSIDCRELPDFIGRTRAYAPLPRLIRGRAFQIATEALKP